MPRIETMGGSWQWERHRLNSRTFLSQPCLPSNHGMLGWHTSWLTTQPMIKMGDYLCANARSSCWHACGSGREGKGVKGECPGNIGQVCCGALQFGSVTTKYLMCDSDWPMGVLILWAAMKRTSLASMHNPICVENGREENTLKYEFYPSLELPPSGHATLVSRLILLKYNNDK